MKILATLFLMLVFLVTRGQDNDPQELGIGFAVATNPYQFNDGSHSENIYSGKDLKTKLKKGKTNNIFPFFYKPDYGLYHFICLAKTSDYYKVLINDTTVAYLPNDTNFYFITWETILLSSTVERQTDDNPIREKSTDTSQIIKCDCKPDRLKVEDIIEKNSEYWIFVSFPQNCELDFTDKTNLIYGWVKWRTKNKLLIEILLLC